MNTDAPDKFIIYNGPSLENILYCFSREYDEKPKYMKLRVQSLEGIEILYLKITDIRLANAAGNHFFILGIDSRGNHLRGFYNSVHKTGYLN